MLQLMGRGCAECVKAALACVFFCMWAPGLARAAYISEIDLGGPAGQGVELSQVDPASDYSVLFINASPTSSFLFGMVLDVLHVPAGTGRAGVAMVTDVDWPGDSPLTTPLGAMPLSSGDDALPLIDHLLLVVMERRTALERLNNPMSDTAAKARYDATPVSDWLVLSPGDQSGTYQANQDIANINAKLGIDLLARLIDTDDGRVIGRTHAPNQTIDMDTFFVGNPDPVSNQFDVDESLAYTYTPGVSGLPLAQTPEPGTLMMLGYIVGLTCCRRPRG